MQKSLLDHSESAWRRARRTRGRGWAAGIMFTISGLFFTWLFLLLEQGHYVAEGQIPYLMATFVGVCLSTVVAITWGVIRAGFDQRNEARKELSELSNKHAMCAETIDSIHSEKTKLLQQRFRERGQIERLLRVAQRLKAKIDSTPVTSMGNVLIEARLACDRILDRAMKIGRSSIKGINSDERQELFDLWKALHTDTLEFFRNRITPRVARRLEYELCQRLKLVPTADAGPDGNLNPKDFALMLQDFLGKFREDHLNVYVLRPVMLSTSRTP